MENKENNLALQKKGAKLLLKAFSHIAVINATALCRGFMYEPEVPKKLKNQK